MGSGEEGFVPVIQGPRLMEALQSSAFAFKVFVVVFFDWWLEENSIVEQVWKVLGVSPGCGHITSTHTPFGRTQA